MAITFTYTESTNVVEVTEGTSGTPATFADFVTADRAGLAEVLPAAAVDANPKSFSLTYAVRPVENLAVTLKITMSADKVGATLDIDGDDWDGNHQDDDTIDISSANSSPVTTTTKWSAIDANGITVNGINDGTTITVEQTGWGVIWDYGNGQYRVDCHFDVGDGGTATHFAIRNNSVTFSNVAVDSSNLDLLFNTTANSTLYLGSVDGEGESYDFAYIQSLENDSDITWTWAGIVMAYGSIVDSIAYTSGAAKRRRVDLTVSNASSVVQDCVFGIAVLKIAGASTWTRNKLLLGGGFNIDAAPTITDFRLGSNYGLSWATQMVLQQFTNFTLEGLVFSTFPAGTEGGIKWNQDGGAPSTWNLRNSTDFGMTDIYNNNGFANDTLNKQFSFDVHVADKDGANLATVNVKLNNGSSDVVDTNTDANGNIASQWITVAKYVNDGTDDDIGFSSTDITETVYTFTATLSKAGYETLVLDNITVDGPIDWHLELQAQKQPPAAWQEGMM